MIGLMGDNMEKYFNKKLRYHNERIILCNNCNYNCGYCLQLSKKHYIMDSNIAKIRIDMLKNRAKEVDSMNINLFGGEPTLNWEVFEMFLDNFKDIENVKLSTISNGSLVNRERIEKISKFKNFNFNLSMDGNETSNRLRLSKGNEKTSNITANTLDLLKQYNIDFTIRSVVGKFNLDNVRDSILYFKKQEVKTLYLQCESCTNGQKLDEQDLKKLIEIVNELKDEDMKISVFSNFNTDQKDIKNYRNSKIEYITQANGIVYSYDKFDQIGVPDFKIYELEFEEDLNFTNIIDMLDLNDFRYKIKEIKNDKS